MPLGQGWERVEADEGLVVAPGFESEEEVELVPQNRPAQGRTEKVLPERLALVGKEIPGIQNGLPVILPDGAMELIGSFVST